MRTRWLGIGALCLLGCGGARAQFAVIDVASVAQLLQEVQTLAQQLEAARQEVAQAQALYQSVTGGRGMQLLLGGLTRNYLPTDWSQLNSAMDGGGSFSTLASAVSGSMANNAVLSGAQLARLSSDAQASITQARRSVALLQGISQVALANSSDRFSSIQQLINAIPSATDEKGILDLQARINAEQGMLQNEQTKLQVLYQAAASQQLAAEQQQREQVLAAQGRFATRFEPTPP